MRVVCFCTYLTDIVSAWRPDDHNAHDFIFAIKGRDFKGYALIPFGGQPQRIDNSNRDRVVEWFGAMAAEYLRTTETEGPISLVPIPGSKCDRQSLGTPRTAALANAISGAFGPGARVCDMLRWKAALASANEQGGSRDPKFLLANLVRTGPVPSGRLILVDDVLTSGGHLQAAEALIHAAGHQVEVALCAGRADAVQPANPFAIRVEEIAEYRP